MSFELNENIAIGLLTGVISALIVVLAQTFVGVYTKEPSGVWWIIGLSLLLMVVAGIILACITKNNSKKK